MHIVPAPDFNRDAEIRRKDSVPEQDRTDDRDEAADAIEEMWPSTLTEIAEEAGFSRQHIKNTLELYFELVNQPDENRVSLDIHIPEDLADDSKTRDAYTRGYVAGYLQRDDSD